MQIVSCYKYFQPRLNLIKIQSLIELEPQNVTLKPLKRNTRQNKTKKLVIKYSESSLSNSLFDIIFFISTKTMNTHRHDLI